jgi:hypothetical protein
MYPDQIVRAPATDVANCSRIGVDDFSLAKDNDVIGNELDESPKLRVLSYERSEQLFLVSRRHWACPAKEALAWQPTRRTMLSWPTTATERALPYR